MINALNFKYVFGTYQCLFDENQHIYEASNMIILRHFARCHLAAQPFDRAIIWPHSPFRRAPFSRSTVRPRRQFTRIALGVLPISRWPLSKACGELPMRLHN